MRKILLTAALGLFSAVAVQAQDDDQETVRGNGKLVTRDVPVTAFTSLKASGVYELKLLQGGSESVKIEADENLHQYFRVKNEGSRLVIDMEGLKGKNLRGKSKMRVYVTFKNLKEMELSTVGNVKSDESLSFADLQLQNNSVGNVDLKFTAKKVNLENTSVGNVTLSGRAESAVFKNNGVGNLNASDLQVDRMDISNNGVGNAEVNAAKELKVNDSMLGKVKNKGAAPVRRKKKVAI